MTAVATSADSEPAGGPLAGLRVLDMSRVLAGPWCTQCLADLGADVLKIEQPGEGDETRGWGPPHMGDLSAYFVCANRSKDSLAVDIKDPAGCDLVRGLASAADVFIENFKTGSLDRMRLGYPDLAALNPRLVYCSITGYGATGPQSQRPGYDFVIQAESGLMSITGEADGRPMKVGVAVSDLLTGLYASQAILAALVGRQATGRGERIDVALFDCQLAAMANVASNSLAGKIPERYGNAHPNVVPYDLFDASDGPFVLAIGNDHQFRKLCEDVLKRPDLAQDARYARNADRNLNRASLTRLLRDFFAAEAAGTWMDRLAAAEIPCGAVHTVDEALESPQAEGRRLVSEFPDGAGRFVRYPVMLSNGLPSPRRAPRIGEGGADMARRWLETASAPLPAFNPAPSHSAQSRSR